MTDSGVDSVLLALTHETRLIAVTAGEGILDNKDLFSSITRSSQKASTILAKSRPNTAERNIHFVSEKCQHFIP